MSGGGTMTLVTLLMSLLYINTVFVVESSNEIYCRTERGCVEGSGEDSGGQETSLDTPNSKVDVHCDGNRACEGSFSIRTNDTIYCRGPYSCYETEVISGGKYCSEEVGDYCIQCLGLRSCSNVVDKIETYSHLVCGGSMACENSNIQMDITRTELQCHGFRACANSYVTHYGDKTIQGYGYLSAMNTIFDGSAAINSSYYIFSGFEAARNATIICGTGHTCNITCKGAGCVGGPTAYCADGSDTSCQINFDCTEHVYSEVCPDAAKDWEGMNLELNAVFKADEEDFQNINADWMGDWEDMDELVDEAMTDAQEEDYGMDFPDFTQLEGYGYEFSTDTNSYDIVYDNDGIATWKDENKCGDSAKPDDTETPVRCIADNFDAESTDGYPIFCASYKACSGRKDPLSVTNVAFGGNNQRTGIRCDGLNSCIAPQTGGSRNNPDYSAYALETTDGGDIFFTGAVYGEYNDEDAFENTGGDISTTRDYNIICSGSSTCGPAYNLFTGQYLFCLGYRTCMFAKIENVDTIYVLGQGDPISYGSEEDQRITVKFTRSIVCIDSYGCEDIIINNVHGGPIFGAGYGVFYKADINNVTGYVGCRGRSCLESGKIDEGRNGGVIISGNYGGYSIEINDWPDEPVIGYGTKVFCRGIFYNIGSIFAVGYKAMCNAEIYNVPTVYVSGEGGLKDGVVKDFTTVIISGIYGCIGCKLSPKPGIHTTVVFKGPGPVSPGGEVSDATELWCIGCSSCAYLTVSGVSKVYVTGGGKFPTIIYSEDTSGIYGHSYDVSLVLIEDETDCSSTDAPTPRPTKARATSPTATGVPTFSPTDRPIPSPTLKPSYPYPTKSPNPQPPTRRNSPTGSPSNPTSPPTPYPSSEDEAYFVCPYGRRCFLNCTQTFCGGFILVCHGPDYGKCCVICDEDAGITCPHPANWNKGCITDSPTERPTWSPTYSPSPKPTNDPSDSPTFRPSESPTTAAPTEKPTHRPTLKPTHKPTEDPTENPTNDPSYDPSRSPTNRPTRKPTDSPTDKPTNEPSPNPTDKPSERPTHRPTDKPTHKPTQDPTDNPTNDPTRDPTNDPTQKPTNRPTERPTVNPSNHPTNKPSDNPTDKPTERPSDRPSDRPTHGPTHDPTPRPSDRPTNKPTINPTNKPTDRPTHGPTHDPTVRPTDKPTERPTEKPTANPSETPTNKPTDRPTHGPTHDPTAKPTDKPTDRPTRNPTETPSQRPTDRPSDKPTDRPTHGPTHDPTAKPTDKPTDRPSRHPTDRPSEKPSPKPTGQPSEDPTNSPSRDPTHKPSYHPTDKPTEKPTDKPTNNPTGKPSEHPSRRPTKKPTEVPSDKPTGIPTGKPSGQPSRNPTNKPSGAPTDPSNSPTNRPTNKPSNRPTPEPTPDPTAEPTDHPTGPTLAPVLPPTKIVYIPYGVNATTIVAVETGVPMLRKTWLIVVIVLLVLSCCICCCICFCFFCCMETDDDDDDDTEIELIAVAGDDGTDTALVGAAAGGAAAAGAAGATGGAGGKGRGKGGRRGKTRFDRFLVRVRGHQPKKLKFTAVDSNGHANSKHLAAMHDDDDSDSRSDSGSGSRSRSGQGHSMHTGKEYTRIGGGRKIDTQGSGSGSGSGRSGAAMGDEMDDETTITETKVEETETVILGATSSQSALAAGGAVVGGVNDGTKLIGADGMEIVGAETEQSGAILQKTKVTTTTTKTQGHHEDEQGSAHGHMASTEDDQGAKIDVSVDVNDDGEEIETTTVTVETETIAVGSEEASAAAVAAAGVVVTPTSQNQSEKNPKRKGGP